MKSGRHTAFVDREIFNNTQHFWTIQTWYAQDCLIDDQLWACTRLWLCDNKQRCCFLWSYEQRSHELRREGTAPPVALSTTASFFSFYALSINPYLNEPHIHLQKIIKRWDSERELSLRRHSTHTTKYRVGQ